MLKARLVVGFGLLLLVGSLLSGCGSVFHASSCLSEQEAQQSREELAQVVPQGALDVRYPELVDSDCTAPYPVELTFKRAGTFKDQQSALAQKAIAAGWTPGASSGCLTKEIFGGSILIIEKYGNDGWGVSYFYKDQAVASENECVKLN